MQFDPQSVALGLLLGAGISFATSWARRRAKHEVESAEEAVRRAAGTADLSDDHVTQIALERARAKADLLESLADGLEKIRGKG